MIKEINQKRQQRILKKLYEDKQDIKAAGQTFPVVKARTCRNCYFWDHCPFPQKPNPNYNFKDFEHPQNRCELLPAGYCVPVKFFRNGWEDDPGHYVDVAIYNLFRILE